MTSTAHPPVDQGAVPPPGPGTDGGGDGPMTAGQWARVGLLFGLLVLLTATTGIWGLVVVIGLVLMLFLHELGHYLAAKRAGMMVTEFFIGFGPRIWSITRGETEYGLKLIPAGAYVRIIGMHNLEEVPIEDEARTYRQGRFRDRLTVVTAGVGMNFALALVLIFVLLAVTGVPGGSITAGPDHAKWNIADVYAGSGAADAGLRAGDKIVSFEGQPITKFTQLKKLVPEREGDTVTITYLRRGEERTTQIALRQYIGIDDEVNCCLGVSENLLDRKVERVNPLAAVPQTFVEAGTIGVKSVQGIARFFSPSGLSNFGHQLSSASDDEDTKVAPGATLPQRSSSSGSSTSGSSSNEKDRGLVSLIGIFQLGTDAANAEALLLLFALLNISLGIINLVPLLPFDGGHVAIAIYETVQERRQRLGQRYFADVAKLLPLTYLVVLILVGIFVTTTYLDIASPIAQ